MFSGMVSCKRAIVRHDWLQPDRHGLGRWSGGRTAGTDQSVVEFADASNPTSYSGATLDDVHLILETGSTHSMSPLAPTNISPPVVADAEMNSPPVAGDSLSVTPGEWSGDPTGYTYQWRDWFADLVLPHSGCHIGNVHTGWRPTWASP